MFQIILAHIGLLFYSFPITTAFTQLFTASQLRYADLANLSFEHLQLIEAEIKSAIRVKPERAPGLLQVYHRFYVEAQVINLIRGQNGIGRDINYLVDIPLDSRGRTPKLKKQHVLLFARRAWNAPGAIQLVALDAQINWSDQNAAMLRRILTEAVAADPPPRITGIGNAFHVAGSIPGEGETQIFLTTASGQPVSLSVLRRPGPQPRWAVALGEKIGRAHATPQRDSLLWYRLADRKSTRLNSSH